METGRAIPVTVSQITVGDEVVMDGGNWTFVVHHIDEGRITRTLRDHRRIAWREPSRYDMINIWVEGPDAREAKRS